MELLQNLCKTPQTDCECFQGWLVNQYGRNEFPYLDRLTLMMFTGGP